MTTKGRIVAKELRVKIAAMLDGDALTRAHRRRGSNVDAKDYEQAYDDIVNPIQRPRRLDIVADLANFAGGAFLGYAIDVLTNDRPDYTRFGLAGLAGICLGGMAVALKNLKLAP